LAKNPDERYQNVAELAVALYPFAPRRARISAERCYHTLKNAGLVSTELQLASVYPPGISSLRATSPSAGAPTPRTTTPAALDILIDEAPEGAAPTRSRAPLWAALGLAATAAGFFALRPRDLPLPSAGASAPVAAPTIATVATPAPPTPPPARVIDLDQDLGAAAKATISTASAASAARAPAPRAASKAVAKPASVRAQPGTTNKRPRGDDELDPGF
jgi:serine/threonine-protein kinase